MDNANGTNNIPKLILVTDWHKYFDYPTLGALRALIFNADKNGFNKVIRRIQSRVLIHVDAFYDWVEEINHINKKAS